MIGRTSPHARRLRRGQTDVEQRLWLELRGRRLGGFKFRRQATIGSFVVDFLCAERKLVVEIDGGQHSEERDAARTAVIEAAGYRIVRYWNSDVLENREGVLSAILTALGPQGGQRAERGQKEQKEPSPNPLPDAREG